MKRTAFVQRPVTIAVVVVAAVVFTVLSFIDVVADDPTTSFPCTCTAPPKTTCLGVELMHTVKCGSATDGCTCDIQTAPDGQGGTCITQLRARCVPRGAG